jgi:hypothetical protein
MIVPNICSFFTEGSQIEQRLPDIYSPDRKNGGNWPMIHKPNKHRRQMKFAPVFISKID